MRTFTKTIPAHDISIKDKWGRAVIEHIPAKIITIVPTLEEVHQQMWNDFGPLIITWKHGWLCPFHPDIRYKNITCSDGLRASSFCNGLRITQSLLPNYPHEAQRLFFLDRVQCFKWCHRLGNAYWDIPISDFLKLPDDIDFAVTWCQHRVYLESGWYTWYGASQAKRPPPQDALRMPLIQR